jgi:Protein  of unknown function (DUF3018)
MATARKEQATRKATREKVKAHRDRLRAQGLRPIQIWVPDVRSVRFRNEIARQCRLIAENPREAQDQAFVESISDIGL